jgi:ABC-type glycerol-3-phosphate transport system substrate-binding protein
MKKLKRILSMILASTILFLAACGNTGDGTDDDNGNRNNGNNNGSQTLRTQGRYVEVDISPPIDGWFSSYLKADGTIVCFDENLTTRFESKDNGEIWNELPGPFRGKGNPYFIAASTLMSDDSLLVFAFDEGLLLIKPDGTVEPSDIGGINEAMNGDNNVNVSMLQALSEDRLLISYTLSSGGMFFSERFTEGSSGEVVIDYDDSDDNGYENDDNSNIYGSSNNDDSLADALDVNDDDSGESGNLHEGSLGSNMMSWDSKTLLIDLTTGEEIRDLAITNAVAAASNDYHLYVIDFNDIVTVFNLHDGSLSDKSDINFMNNDSANADSTIRMLGRFGGSGMLALGNDGKLYNIIDGDLLYADANGSINTLLDRSSYSIGTPRNNAMSMFVLDDESIIVNVLSNGQKNVLYKYIWDENAVTDPDKTLTIWSLEDNSFVRAAIAEMRKKNPDATIIYDVALSGSVGMTAADAVRSLNTRLLGGDAPDVIIFDGITFQSYVDRGMMLDLSEFLNINDVYSNILDPFKSDGRIYSLPMQFIMPVLMGSNNALAKAHTIDDLVDEILSSELFQINFERGGDPFSRMNIDESEQSALHFDNLQELSDFLWASAASGIVNDNILDTTALRRYLETIKAISDKLGLMDDSPMEGMFSVTSVTSDGSSASVLPGSLTRHFMHQAKYAAFLANNLMILQMAASNRDSDLMLFPGFDQGAWLPGTITGISADTQRPEFAAEFLQTMLSLEVQQQSYGTGIPVTRTGMAAQVEALKESHISFGGNSVEFDFDIDSLMSQLKTVSIVDTVLKDMIWDTVERLCKGIIDVDGAVGEIERNVRTYLAERA